MGKDPAFLFYYQEFMHGTRKFTAEQRGIYIELICEQADSKTGSIKKEDMMLICGRYEEEVSLSVKLKFVEDENGFYNEKLRDILYKRREYCKSRSYNRSTRKTHVKHMGNGNRIKREEIKDYSVLFLYWEENKKGKQYKTEESRNGMIERLKKLTAGDIEHAKEAIFFAVDNEYQGFCNGAELYYKRPKQKTEASQVKREIPTRTHRNTGIDMDDSKRHAAPPPKAFRDLARKIGETNES